nr:hypothetical protein Iba_chr15bCG6430 [Ipomoea batatas]
MTTAENPRADDDTRRRLGQMTRAEKTKADFDGRGGYGKRQQATLAVSLVGVYSVQQSSTGGRSLFDSLVALREIYLDFRVRSEDVFLIKSKNLIIFKLDAIEAKNMDQLKMLRRHPMFYVDDSKELLFDFVVKFHRIMSIIDNEKWKKVIKKLIDSFKKMNYDDIVDEDSKWYSENIDSPIKKCIDFVPPKPCSQENPEAPSKDKRNQNQPTQDKRNQNQPS